MGSKNPSLPSFLLFMMTCWSLFAVCSSLDVNFLRLSPPWMGGQWFLLHSSIGVSAMHMQLLKNNKVVIFDRMDMGPSNLSLPRTYCIHRPNKTLLDCTAHSLLYDVPSNTFRPLLVKTDTWCSSGSVDPDGTLIQTGGFTDGERVVRTFTPCDDKACEWQEFPGGLKDRRWYASNQVLPDGRVIILGGRQAYTYEFFPNHRPPPPPTSYYMRFLRETTDRYGDENNLYPFLHLLPDGNLFVFANRRSILFDYKRNRIVKELPLIPGAYKRNYPSTGSSVLLPLRLNGTHGLPEAEVMVCGGAPCGAFNMSDKNRVFVSAANTCGRLRVTDPQPRWVMEEMPMPRVMSDMLLLPTGDVLLINGAMNGTAGWEDATNPVYSPVIYRPNEPDPERRFVVLKPSRIPRMYHSTAVLLPDGRILVGGSNPHTRYNFTAKPFPTDLSLEAYHPYYLYPLVSPLRPSILSVESLGSTVSYGQVFSVTFVLRVFRPERGIDVSLIAPPFNTHSSSMSQRMVFVEVVGLEQLSFFTFKITVIGPPTKTVAPPGYYMLFVVHAAIPSHAVWVKVQH